MGSLLATWCLSSPRSTTMFRRGVPCLAALVMVLGCRDPVAVTPSPPIQAAWQLAVVDGGTDIPMSDVVLFRDAFVAVGTGSTRTAVWARSDSSTWKETRTVGLDRVADGFVSADAIAANGDILVLLGTDSRALPLSPVVWHSSDGRVWQMVDSAAFVSDQNLTLEDIVWTGSRFMAIGTESRAGSPVSSALVVMVSPDGSSWARIHDSRFENPELTVPTAIAAIADHVIAATIGPTATTLFSSLDDGAS